MLGRTVGKYRIVERLGRGGMGTVYKAVDETLDREVAIKVLNADLRDAELMKRFRAEAVTLARLNHPGIATLYELYRDDENLLMVMEYVRGETLHDLAERLGAMPPPQAAHLAIQILDALAHAHRWGVVHRDLKPANLMVTETGAVKVMDFGIARVLGTEHFTQGGYMMGTPAYMAPEQVLGGEVDGRADLYAVGVVLYRLLSGQLPFSADTAIAMVQKQVNEAPTPISAFQPGLPHWCGEILARALAKSPDERFQTAEEFRTALKASATPLAFGDMPTMETPTPLGLRADLTVAHAPPQATVPAATRADVAVVEPPAAQSVATDALPPAGARKPDANTTTLVLSRKHVMALSGVGLAVLIGIGVLGFLALRQPSFPSELTFGAAPAQETPVEPASPEEAPPAPDTPAADTATVPAGTAANATQPATPTAAPPAPAAPVPPPAPSGRAAGARAGSGAAAAAAAKETPAATGPAEAATPAPEPAATADALPPVTFPEVRLLLTTDGKSREVEGVLRLGDGRVSVAGKDGAPLMSVPYSALTGAAYSRSKQPRWTDAGGQETNAKVDLGPFGVFRSERNWVVFLTNGDPMIVRIEDGALRTVLPAIEERTGVKLRR
jgi:serine/threonine-protein kinase